MPTRTITHRASPFLQTRQARQAPHLYEPHMEGRYGWSTSQSLLNKMNGTENELRDFTGVFISTG